jgi:hypothetical protein
MDSRHMNQTVDLAKCFNSAFDYCDAFFLVGHVCASFDKARSMICSYLIDRKWLQVHSANAVAICEQAFHAGKANAAGGTGNDDMFGRDR